MDKLATYRQIIRTALEAHLALTKRAPVPGVETLAVFDETHDEYLLRNVGWHQRQRVRETFIHVRIHDGKIWIEEDWTEAGIATDLLEAGVPKADIVLAFHPPEMRQYTEFAAA